MAPCQLDILKDCLDLPLLRIALDSLLGTLSDMYARILDNILDAYRRNAIKLLQFLLYLQRPLRITELVDAIATDPSVEPAFNPENRMSNPSEIIRLCSSLVLITNQ